MTEKISINLEKQEQLLVDIRLLTNSTTQLVGHLQQVVEGLPSLTSHGEAHNRMIPEGGGQLASYVSKAQTMQTLTEVLFKHTLNTHRTMIDTDKLLAIDIANSILNSPEAPEEDKQALRDKPDENFNKLKESIQTQGQDDNGQDTIGENLRKENRSSADILSGTGGAWDREG